MTNLGDLTIEELFAESNRLEAQIRDLRAERKVVNDTITEKEHAALEARRAGGTPHVVEPVGIESAEKVGELGQEGGT